MPGVVFFFSAAITPPEAGDATAAFAPSVGASPAPPKRFQPPPPPFAGLSCGGVLFQHASDHAPPTGKHPAPGLWVLFPGEHNPLKQVCVQAGTFRLWKHPPRAPGRIFTPRLRCQTYAFILEEIITVHNPVNELEYLPPHPSFLAIAAIVQRAAAVRARPNRSQFKNNYSAEM